MTNTILNILKRYKKRKHKKKNIIYSFNSIRLFRIEEYNVGAPLAVLLDCFDINQYSLINLWKVPIYEDTYHVKDDDGKVMFLLSNSYRNRDDLEKCFLKVANLLENKIIAMPIRGEMRKNFSMQENIMMGIWIAQMKVNGMSLKEKIFCANLLMSARKNLEKISKIIDKKQVRSIVTLGDVHLIDYFVTEYCNRRKIKTVTLQHGFFPAGDLFFRYSESDYFLTYGEYSKKLANQYKKTRGIFIAAGMPEYIGENKILSRVDKKRESFLVLLNGGGKRNHINNRNMLKICKIYAEENYCTFDILSHPVTNKEHLNEYQSIVSDKGIFIKTESNISDIFDKYLFCVANRTTMVLKAIYELMPIILYCSKGEKSFFGIQFIDLNFSSYREMKNCIFNITEQDIENTLLKVRDYLCGSGDIASNYMKVLEKL